MSRRQICNASDAVGKQQGPDLALQSQAEGGIGNPRPPLYESTQEVEAEGSEGSSEGINALQIRLFRDPDRERPNPRFLGLMYAFCTRERPA
jgi:hypothetical protein